MEEPSRCLSLHRSLASSQVDLSVIRPRALTISYAEVRRRAEASSSAKFLLSPSFSGLLLPTFCLEHSETPISELIYSSVCLARRGNVDGSRHALPKKLPRHCPVTNPDPMNQVLPLTAHPTRSHGLAASAATTPRDSPRVECGGGSE